MPLLEQIDPKIVGLRLAEARKARGITQEDAATHLGCSRPTFIAIEKGTRQPKAEEVVALAKLYGQKVSDIVRPGEPLADLQPHLRAVAQQMKVDDSEVVEGIEALQRFAEDYRRLERILSVSLPTNYPEVVTIGRGSPVSLAEDVADQERRRLGVGDQPVIHLRSLLEAEVGLRIAYEDLPSRVAGMFAYSSEMGGVILVNRKHPPERRRATLLHEYGHLITDRFKPGIDYLAYPGRKPANERFAEAFSMAFLMPPTSVRRRFNQIVNESGDFQIADLCRLSHLYYVSVEAMTLRLEGLGLIPKGVRDHLKESRFEVRRAGQMLNLQQHPVTDGRFPDRYVFLAVQAFDQGDLSEGELASVLRCDRVSAREIVEQYLTTTEVSENGEIRSVQLETQYSLLGEKQASTAE
ncbi:ImmA/IrrE family metallo-endopeptidase [Planctomicrobium sp. SH527]|uniref:ImmA/IrrE family metallo-endopeptidase n=1 Tax=Planctomicrobium sp. SH527 TaxID=3448123 RepID=UPI003F5B5FE6